MVSLQIMDFIETLRIKFLVCTMYSRRAKKHFIRQALPRVSPGCLLVKGNEITWDPSYGDRHDKSCCYLQKRHGLVETLGGSYNTRIGRDSWWELQYTDW